MAKDEFVDLYALLGIEPDADVATIRKRVTESYLDAQNNLDHRNATKRLQYQQMYEVYLPQARHLLLDVSRRAEYDQYLQAYKSGKPLSQVEVAPAPVVETSGLVSMVEEFPEMPEPDVDPAVLAQQREELWGKWKSGLNFSDDESPSVTTAAPAANAEASSFTVEESAAPPKAAAVPPVATPERRAQPRAASPEAARRPQIQTVALGEGKEVPKARPAGQRLTQEEIEKRTREEWERNREKQREQIVADAVAGAGLTWSFIGGGVTFLVALIALFVVDSIINNTGHYPFGMSRLVFTLIGFALSLGLAALGAFITAKKMRDKTLSSLKSLTLEELQRRGK